MIKKDFGFGIMILVFLGTIPFFINMVERFGLLFSIVFCILCGFVIIDTILIFMFCNSLTRMQKTLNRIIENENTKE